MDFPENGLLLAGFVLAHALWSVSDLPKGALLVPLAVIETNEGRQLHRFASQTQVEAIAKGKNYLSKLGPGVKAWAFAREGLMNDGKNKIDVISVDVWAVGMYKPITLVQRFEPYGNKGHFRVIGEPDLVVNGVTQKPPDTQKGIDLVLRGVLSHPKVAPLWEAWHNP